MRPLDGSLPVEVINGTAASTHRLLDDGTPTTTRIAAERGLQAAEHAWRTSHSSEGQALLLGSQGLAAALGIAVIVVLVLVLRRRAPREDAHVSKESDTPSKRRLGGLLGRMRVWSAALLRLGLPELLASRVVRRVSDWLPNRSTDKRGSDVGVEMHRIASAAELGELASSSHGAASAAELEHGSHAERLRTRAMPTLHGSSSQPPTVLPPDVIQQLRGELPLRYNLREWALLYSTEQHGCSLRTFYSRLERQEGTLLVVLDGGGHIFGAFVAEAWRNEGRYFGNGETFMYKVHPSFARYDWTRANAHFVLGSQDCVAFGGGGKFALYLDSSLEFGSSDSSPTYDNECLAGSHDFRCIKVEVWGFV